MYSRFLHAPGTLSPPSEKQTLCLGLIGGLGVGATVHYYQALAKAHEQLKMPLRLLMVHADVERVLGYVQASEMEALTEYLAGLIEQLRNGGADIAVITAMTPHICIRKLIPRSPLPLVDVLAVAREAMAGKRIALFGTRFTIETDLFGALQGNNTVRPTQDEVGEIHNAYVRTARKGQPSEDDRQTLISIAHRIIQREKLEAIVLAGTDLALLFNESNTPFPFIDCSRLHIDAIMRTLLPSAPS